MSYTFEMIDEVIAEKNDEFVELRKGETNIYSSLNLWKGDVVTLKRESGQQVLAVIIGFDEESMLMNALELKTEKSEGKYIDEATVILKDSDEQQTYYVNCMKSLCCKGTCIGELYGTVTLKDINNIAIDMSVAFGLKAAFFDAPCALNTRYAAQHEKESKDKKSVKSSNKDAVSIYSASLKKQNAELKQEVQVLRGKLEKPKELSSAQTDIKNLEGRIEVLTTENNGKDRRIKDLTEEKNRLETKVSSLNQVIDNKNRELKTSKDLAKAQRNTITTNSTTLKRFQNERDTLLKKNTELFNQIESFKADYNASRRATEKTINDLKNENEQLKRSLDDTNGTREQYMGRIDKLTAQISTMEVERNGLNREIESLRNENKNLLIKAEEGKVETEKSASEIKVVELEKIVPVPSTDLEMRVHDLELSLNIYKELYRDVVNRLIESR